MRKGKDVDIDKNRQMVLKRVRVRYFLGHFEVLKDFNLLGNAENDVNLSKKFEIRIIILSTLLRTIIFIFYSKYKMANILFYSKNIITT